MTDKEKVIKGLQEAVDWLSTETSLTVVDQWVIRDALALLKAQEPVEPVRMNHTENKYRDHYRCPICKEDLSYEQNYCPDCGKRLKWK